MTNRILHFIIGITLLYLNGLESKGGHDIIILPCVIYILLLL